METAMAKIKCSHTLNKEVLETLDWFAEYTGETRSQVIELLLIDRLKMHRILNDPDDQLALKQLNDGGTWHDYSEHIREKMLEDYQSQFGPNEE